MLSPFDFFARLRCVNLDSATERWREMQERFDTLGIADRVRRFPAVSTPGNHHIGCALSHRRIVEEAQADGHATVLVFEDDAIFLDRTLDVLAEALPELARIDWNLCYLGGFRWDGELAPMPGCSHWRWAREVTCTHAIAYSQRFYARLLDDLPADLAGMEQWQEKHKGIDQYLRREIDRAVMIHPPLATQPFALPYEDPEHQFHFTI
jgi:hypothetical protein